MMIISRSTVSLEPHSCMEKKRLVILSFITTMYHQKAGGGFPGAFMNNDSGEDAIELCKRLCVQGCKDGFYWSTNFKGKNQCTMVDAPILQRNMLVNSTGVHFNQKSKCVRMKAILKMNIL